MQSVSVVIITFNEQNNIASCIKSVQSFASEIIVVDSFSTDNTVEIAKLHGANVHLNHFKGHIEQKNWAKNKAKFDWVLSLDADERVDDIMQNSIKQVLNNPNQSGYYFNRKNHIGNKWITCCGWYPDAKLRLFNAKHGDWTGQNPHDKFVLQNLFADNKLEGNILHYTYKNIAELKKQATNFGHIAAKHNANKTWSFLFFKIIVAPVAKFFKAYFIQFGFANGYLGWVISVNQVKEVWLKYLIAIKIKSAKT